ncbi:GntR family transcriptional regulator, partial [Intrasporangium sp.]|uniref:GntR family transcriptional regulator n=1 Tax=Intrasporangium sp. TaxID=1925024 RepID=UPI00346399EE
DGASSAERSGTSMNGTEDVDSSPVERLRLPNFHDRLSLRQQVADALRAQLVTGQMRPGISYSAPKLAQQFGVSATPVREAMLDLVSEGLVEVVRNKGFRPTTLSGAELDALAEIRAMVEIPTMALVAGGCVGEVAAAVENLRPLARQIVVAAQSLDLITYIEADTEFHLRFLALHGNPVLVKVVRDLRARSRLYGLQVLAEAGKLGQLAVEHEQMVDLALSRQVEPMRVLMTQHIAHLRSVWAGDAGVSE